MGSFGRRLGQLAARSLESESARILKSGSANKRGLSKLLDATLREGHDMQTFGLGTAAALASRERYSRFTSSMHAVYDRMEASLDRSGSVPIALVWGRHGDHLRRAPALAEDLAEVGVQPGAAISPATQAYLDAIDCAAADDERRGGGRLLGHLYCRYFADLFGGQALAAPSRYALALGPCSPRHYDFGGFVAGRRREAIESVYEALNEAGDAMDAGAGGGDPTRAAVAEEARRAFALNVSVYAEDGRLYADAARGVANVIGGWAAARVERARGGA